MLVIDGMAILRNPEAEPLKGWPFWALLHAAPLVAIAAPIAPILGVPLWARALVAAGVSAVAVPYAATRGRVMGVPVFAPDGGEPSQYFWTGSGSYAQQKHDAIESAYDLGLDSEEA